LGIDGRYVGFESDFRHKPNNVATSTSDARRGPSASPCCLDGGDVDLLHRHHRLEGAFGLGAAGRKGVSERTRGDLPGEAPAVLAPSARTFLAAVADDGVPVLVRLLLIVRRDLERKGFAVLILL
jgi:hypothetical protein